MERKSELPYFFLELAGRAPCPAGAGAPVDADSLAGRGSCPNGGMLTLRVLLRGAALLRYSPSPFCIAFCVLLATHLCPSSCHVMHEP